MITISCALERTNSPTTGSLPTSSGVTVTFWPGLRPAGSVGSAPGCAAGVVALAISIVGVAGVLAFSVSARTREFGVRLAIGSNAASVWWVNGQEVIGIYGDRQTVIDDGVSKRLTLNKGPNIVRTAVVNGGGATDFCARFLDATDKPLKGYTVNLGPVH